jgi:DNA-binding NarL/FixJ family response regulator
MNKAGKNERQKAFGEHAKVTRNRAGGPDKLLVKNLTGPLAKTKVLIVYQPCWICRAMRSLIDGIEGFAVCAETEDARSAIALFERHQPEVVVLGLGLAHGDGLQLIKILLKLAPAVLILVLSDDVSAMSIRRALRAGAVGYLTVEHGDLELPTALDAITCRGHRYISQGLWGTLIKSFAPSLVGRPHIGADLLTDRELEVFSSIGRGSGILETAKELGVSIKTVETHQIHIKRKLKLSSAIELRKYATCWMAKRAWSPRKRCG